MPDGSSLGNKLWVFRIRDAGSNIVSVSRSSADFGTFTVSHEITVLTGLRARSISQKSPEGCSKPSPVRQLTKPPSPDRRIPISTTTTDCPRFVPGHRSGQIPTSSGMVGELAINEPDGSMQRSTENFRRCSVADKVESCRG